MVHTIQGNLNASGLSFAIVLSRFNGFVTQRLLEGALDALTRTGAAEGDIEVIKVPGSFEIPLAAKKAAGTGKYHGVICLGTLIQGETPHFTLYLQRGGPGNCFGFPGFRSAGGLWCRYGRKRGTGD